MDETKAAVTITGLQLAGESLQVHDDHVLVELVGIPGAGYRWHPVNAGDAEELEDDGPVETDLVGGYAPQVFRVPTRPAGHDVRFTYSRAWETEAPLREVTVIFRASH